MHLLDADVEAAAHFDHWQRAHLDDENVRQDLWPEALRNARVIPAVEYIQVWAGELWLGFFLCCHAAVSSILLLPQCTCLFEGGKKKEVWSSRCAMNFGVWLTRGRRGEVCAKQASRN